MIVGMSLNEINVLLIGLASNISVVISTLNYANRP